jgi:hypothetical protein
MGATAQAGPIAPHPMPTNTPQTWQDLEATVRAAVAPMSDTELANYCAQLQRGWRETRESVVWEILQAVYTEQHRRRFA